MSDDGLFENWAWTEFDVDRLKRAFKRRFGEELPRTETLFCVAAEGVRIYMERLNKPSNVTQMRRKE